MRDAGLPVLAGSGHRPTPHQPEPDDPPPVPDPEEPLPLPEEPLDDTQATIIYRPVRTGQRAFAPRGDLTLLAQVNAGAEVIAAGSIHVYAPLRGRALAGVRGDRGARIFTLAMEAELVSIAGCYRLLDDFALRGKPAQAYLDGEKLVIAPL